MSSQTSNRAADGKLEADEGVVGGGTAVKSEIGNAFDVEMVVAGDPGADLPPDTAVGLDVDD